MREREKEREVIMIIVDNYINIESRQLLDVKHYCQNEEIGYGIM